MKIEEFIEIVQHDYCFISFNLTRFDFSIRNLFNLFSSIHNCTVHISSEQFNKINKTKKTKSWWKPDDEWKKKKTNQNNIKWN